MNEEKQVDFKTIFKELNAIDCSEHVEEKQGLAYLSWAWAVAEVSKRFNWSYEILPPVEDENGYMVNTSVTIEGNTRVMWLPVMDGANKAMKKEPYKYSVKKKDGGSYEKTVEAYNAFDINKTVMRCLVKNLAMFGLGLYIYAGEDLPETSNDSVVSLKETPKEPAKTASKKAPTKKAKAEDNGGEALF